MIYYFYILYSEKSDKFYVGSTKDLEQRMDSHNRGNTPSTRYARPWKLVYTEEYDSYEEAVRREYSVKRKKSRKYILYLISSSSG